jgi:hypothetical protein
VALGLVVIIVIVIAVRLGPLKPAARRAVPITDAGTRPLTSRQLREAAEASAAAADAARASTGMGDYTTAILQRFRAIAVSLEERGVLVPDAGRTADELATQAGRLFPRQAAGIAAAARLFDQVRYGDGVGARDDYEEIRQLDDALGQVRPGDGVVLAHVGALGGAQ